MVNACSVLVFSSTHVTALGSHHSPERVCWMLRFGPPEAGLLEFLLGDGHRRHLGIVQTQANLRLAREPADVDALDPI